MIVELKPETERLLNEELANGHFGSVDEVILRGLHSTVGNAQVGTHPKESFAQFMRRSPVFGSGIVLDERVLAEEREVDL